MNNPVLFSFDSSTRTKNKLSLDLQNDAASGSTAEGVVLWVNQRWAWFIIYFIWKYLYWVTIYAEVFLHGAQVEKKLKSHIVSIKINKIVINWLVTYIILLLETIIIN